MVVMSIPLVHASPRFFLTSVRARRGLVHVAVRGQVLHDGSVFSRLLLAPRCEISGTENLCIVVAHGSVPQTAELAALDTVRAGLLGGCIEDVVVKWHRVGLNAEG